MAAVGSARKPTNGSDSICAVRANLSGIAKRQRAQRGRGAAERHAVCEHLRVGRKADAVGGAGQIACRKRHDHGALSAREQLSIARKKCVHDERFYNIRFRKILHTKSIKSFKALAIPRDSGNSSAYGTQDAYAIAIILTLILNKADIKSFIISMSVAFDKRSKRLNTISASWKNLPQLKP